MLSIYKLEKVVYFHNSDDFNILCICIRVFYKHNNYQNLFCMHTLMQK